MTNDTQPHPMRGNDLRTVYRADYRPFPFAIDHVGLVFHLHATATRVAARLTVRRTQPGDPCPLWLDGEGLKLLSLRQDDAPIDPSRISQLPEAIEITGLPDHFVLDIETQIDPSANTLLSGLYLSQGGFFTQCEAEGFRRITYFPDRPDVMSRYTVTLSADKQSLIKTPS